MDDRRFVGHPRGLALLFLVEMWERFSYYGMRALLILYLVNVLHWPDARAANLYGTYTGRHSWPRCSAAFSRTPFSARVALS